MVVDAELNELKSFLYDTTNISYTDYEIEYIIQNKLLDF